MKRILTGVLVLGLLLTLLGCQEAPPEANVPENGGVTLRIVTTYGGDDGNRCTFEEAVAEYERRTGNTVLDNSDTSNENWKARVMSDFETGSEPDVLFFFTDADAEPLIRAKKVVSIPEIQRLYPDYASNMDPDKLPTASDGRCYAVPITGYWEYLYVNKEVLSACGIPVPGPDYRWEQFLEDCRTIRQAGYTPIACSLSEVAHYWFEFAVLNNGSPANHGEIPTLDENGRLVDDDTSRKWIAALEDIRRLYEAGFFPANTLTAGDAQTVAMFGEGQAAFLLDGSWKVGFFSENYPDTLEHYTVCHFPGKGQRETTQTIGGISTGFFITRRAWEDEEKRQAAVEFVSFLTSDEVVKTFVTTEITALAVPIPAQGLNPLQQSAANTMAATTQWVGAVQDRLSGEARSSLLLNIQNVVSGKLSAHDAVEQAMQFNK